MLEIYTMPCIEFTFSLVKQISRIDLLLKFWVHYMYNWISTEYFFNSYYLYLLYEDQINFFFTCSLNIICSYLIKRDFVFSRYAGVNDPKPVATVCFYGKHFQRNSFLVLSAAIWNWKWSLRDNRRYKKKPSFFHFHVLCDWSLFCFFQHLAFVNIVSFDVIKDKTLKSCSLRR